MPSPGGRVPGWRRSGSARRSHPSSSGGGTATPSARARSSTASRSRTTRSCSATWPSPADAIRAAIAAGRRICVHGDYDVDGICATALAVTVLRGLGADVDWHLPSRFEEGYGLAGETLARLAEAGYGLVLTVDCGITAVDEVAHATALGLDVVVTDHHRPGERAARLPGRRDPPVRLPVPRALRHRRRLQARPGALAARTAVAEHLDLVALATVADVVPLVDENRSARRRRAAAAGPDGPARGCSRSCASRGVDPAAVDAGAIGFRLAPRINAAGRLGHPRRRARAAAHRATPPRPPVLAAKLEDAEPRPPGGRGADPARGDRARSPRGRSARAAAAPTCSGARTGMRA